MSAPPSTEASFKTAAELGEAERALLGVSARDNTLFSIQGDGSWIARVRPWRPGLLPHLDVGSIRAWAEERARRIQSVVVFGSHARGTDHRHSDVDLYVVGRLSGKDKTTLEKCLSPSSVDIIDRTSMTKFRAGVAERRLSIENQVMRHGVQIFGRPPETKLNIEGEQYSMDEIAFYSHFAGATRVISKGLSYFTEYIFFAKTHGLAELDLRDHVADSSDAAERAAKAILTSVGLSPEHKHDIPALQAQLVREAHQRSSTRTPRGLPDTETLERRIESMNHETSKGLHTLVYLEGGVYMTYEEGRDLVNNAQERIAAVIDSLVWLFAIISRDEQLSELAKKCRIQLEACFRVAMRKDSSESPTLVCAFEQAIGIRTSLPKVLRRTRAEFEDIANIAAVNSYAVGS